MSKPRRVPITYFAPAERVSIEVVHRQASALSQPPLPGPVLDSPGTYVFVLNAQHQIVFATPNVRELTAGTQPRSILGLRLGEFVNCIHSKETPAGCGTSKACRNCGWVQSMLSSLAGTPDSRDFQLIRRVGARRESLQLVVFSKPMMHEGEVFSAVALTRGSQTVSTAELERLFFDAAVGSGKPQRPTKFRPK
ncbi:MAG: hypothetical protein AB9869_25595 [Verrucomicrobiia bacterium]